MPDITLAAAFTPNASVVTTDPVFGNNTRHNITAAFSSLSGDPILPAHVYTAGSLVIKFHVVGPYVSFWNYYFTLRVDSNTAHIPAYLSRYHAYQQPYNMPYGGPGAALEDDYALPQDWVTYLNGLTGTQVSFILSMFGTLQIPQSSPIVLDSAILTLTYATTPTGSFAKRWSAAMSEGRALCTFVDVDNKLYVSTARDLKRQITPQSGAKWGTPYSIADHARDCNVGVHPNKGRGQLWYTQLDASNANPASVYVTSPTAGAAQDWSTLTTIPPQPAGSGLTLANCTQPWTPARDTGGNWRYVSSQSQGQGACAAGPDKRLCCTPTVPYTLTATGGGTIVGNAFVCKDGGIGDKWEWRDLTGNGPWNSVDGAAKLPATALGSPYYGKTYPVVAGGAPNGSTSATAPVRADNGTLYQLVWSLSYQRRAKLYPRPGTETAFPDGTGNSFTNNFDNGSASGTSLTNHYTMDVPAGSETIQGMRWNWPVTVRERALVTGRWDNPNKPTKLRFDLPALLDIPAYTDGTGAYGGSSYLYASVVWDYTYIGANGLQLALTHTLRGGGAGDFYPVGQQAKTLAVNGRGEYTGSAAWDYYGNFDIDRSRLSTIEFNVLQLGTVDTLTIKSAGLHIHNLQTETSGDTLTLTSAQIGSTAASLGGLYGGIGTQAELTKIASYTGNVDLMDEINGRRGTTWQCDLTWQQANTLGSGGTNKLLPKDDLLQNQYAQCYYNASATDATKRDFFLVRSRDNGQTWEYAGNGARITALSTLRDWNNTNPTDVKLPSLLTERNVVYLVWVDNSKPQTLASQDAGETWTGVTT